MQTCNTRTYMQICTCNMRTHIPLTILPQLGLVKGTSIPCYLLHFLRGWPTAVDPQLQQHLGSMVCRWNSDALLIHNTNASVLFFAVRNKQWTNGFAYGTLDIARSSMKLPLYKIFWESSVLFRVHGLCCPQCRSPAEQLLCLCGVWLN